MNQHTCFTCGDITFEVDNYRDWKPGIQLNLAHLRIPSGLDVGRTFRSPESAYRYVRKALRQRALDILAALDRESDELPNPKGAL